MITRPLNFEVFETFETDRLVLRSKWQNADLEPFAALNCDPTVMEFFPSLLSFEETRSMVERINAHFDQHGFGLYACELKSSGEFIGFVGLAVPRFQAHFTPCVEIGWRLAQSHWNQGLCTEAAGKVMSAGFQKFGLKEIVSMTARVNVRSQRIMQKLGMHTSADDDFDHPNVAAGVLKPHVLYRLSRDEFVQAET